MRKLLLAAMAVTFQMSAHAAPVIFTDKAAFLAATTSTETGFPIVDCPDPTFGCQQGSTYTLGAVTFSTLPFSQGTSLYNDGLYGAGIGYLEADIPVIVTSTTTALGFDIGSYFEPFTVTYTVNGVTGTIDLPAPNPGDVFIGSGNTTFLGFLDTQPIGVILNNDAQAALDFTSVFTGQAAPVPEPSSWMMMIGGLLATGAVLRRRRLQAIEA